MEFLSSLMSKEENKQLVNSEGNQEWVEKCDLCAYQFLEERCFIIHIAETYNTTEQLSEDNVVCHYCGISFKEDKKLSDHSQENPKERKENEGTKKVTSKNVTDELHKIRQL